MEINLIEIGSNKVNKANVSDAIFGLEANANLISSLVNWSSANAKPLRARTKNRSEVKGTTQKSVRQKGSGGARHGSKKANIFRSGGMAHNLRGIRSSKKMPKRTRNLAIKHILSSKIKDNNIILVENLMLKEPKTKALNEIINNLKISSALFLEGDKPDLNFALASRNLKNIKFLNVSILNALDLLKYETIVISKSAMELLEKRVLNA